MYLSDEEQPETSRQPAENPAAPVELNGNSGGLAILNLLRRDPRLWVIAIFRNWLLLVLIPLATGLLFMAVRALAKQRVYKSSCALIRQAPTDPKTLHLIAPGYSPAQLSVVFNVLRGRRTLNATLRRLNLPWNSDRLFHSISVKQAEKNSNYFFVSASTGDPQLSAKLANTVSEIFLEHYKLFIRSQLMRGYEGSERSRRTLSGELDDLQAKMRKICSELKIIDLERAIANLGTSLTQELDGIKHEETQIKAYRSKLANLETQIAVTPENVEVYSERSTTREQQLTAMKLQLTTLLQRYTEENPIVIKQRELVRIQERELATANKDGQTKVVIGKNAEYHALKSEIMRTRAELVTSESKLSVYGKNAREYRARLETLNQYLPEVRQLDEQIEQKKRLLRQQESLCKELELFLERSYSDISIQESAVPPPRAQPRKVVFFAAVGVFLGVMAALGIVLVREGVDLTVRSRYDISHVLGVRALGVVPNLTPEHRSDFYSALQRIVTDGCAALSKTTKPPLIAVAPYSLHEIEEHGGEEIFSLLSMEYPKILHIQPLLQPTPETAPHLLNDFLYGLSDELPKPTADDVVYFAIDDMAFIAPPAPERIKAVHTKAAQYNLLIWTLFDYDQHPPLFAEICSAADMTVIPMHYAESSKLHLNKMLGSLYEQGLRTVYGFLFSVNNKYYRWVN